MGNVTKMAQHTVRVAGWPSPSTQHHGLTLALRMVRMYGDRVPTIQQLMSDFEICRATAYRWRAAFVASMQQKEAA